MIHYLTHRIAAMTAQALQVLVFTVTLGPLHPALAAEGDSYLCEFDPGGQFADSIPEVVAFVVGADGGGTLVFDPFINFYYKVPIEAKLLADNASRVSIRWVLKA